MNLNDMVCSGGLKLLADSKPADIVISSKSEGAPPSNWTQESARFRGHLAAVAEFNHLLDVKVPPGNGTTQFQPDIHSDIMMWGFSQMEFALPMVQAHYVRNWSGQEAPEKKLPKPQRSNKDRSFKRNDPLQELLQMQFQ